MGNALQSVLPSIPNSDEKNYYIDPKIINPVGHVNFNSGATSFRVSKEEFLYLRDKSIQNGGSAIKIAQFLWYFRQFLILFLLAILVWRTILLFTDTSVEESQLIIGLVIYFCSTIAVIIITKVLGNYYAKQASKGIKAFLGQQNSILYNKRGLNWKIHPSCVYLQLEMQDYNRGNSYTAPNVNSNASDEAEGRDENEQIEPRVE